MANCFDSCIASSELEFDSCPYSCMRTFIPEKEIFRMDYSSEIESSLSSNENPLLSPNKMSFPDFNETSLNLSFQKSSSLVEDSFHHLFHSSFSSLESTHNSASEEITQNNFETFFH